VIARGLVAAAALAWSAAAAAHAELVASTPADGAALASAPAAIELRFNEPVRPLSLRLAGGAGGVRALAVPDAAGEVVRISPPALADGQYTLSYRVISLDSHPVAGSIAFAIGAAARPAAAHAESEVLVGWRVALRAVRDLALLVAAGGAMFLLAVGSFPAHRTLVSVCALAAALAALAGTALQGAAIHGGWEPESWRTGLHSTFGLSACVVCAAAALVTAGCFARRRWLLAAGALAAVTSFPLTGHAAAAGPAWQLALAAHAGAAAFWAGSLAALHFMLGKEAAVPALRRFSRLGVLAVVVLVAAGVASATIHLRALGDVTGSPYGRLVIGKAVLLALLLVLAVLNRYRFLPLLEAGEGRASARLRWSIAGELALVACVGVMTAILVQTPPPRSADSFQILESAGRVAELSVGRQRMVVQFRGFEPAEVVAEISNAAAGVEPLVRPMAREAPGRYGVETALPIAGTWTVRIQARIGDFEQAIFRAQVRVR
jgi:copper transport protein